MKVVAVIGQKGGSGKTTTAENLAVEAARSGKTVALIDLDSQPTAATWGDRRKDDDPTVAVVSAQIARLKHVLDAARKQGTAIAILDTPPRTSEASIEAAKAADLVLVPLRPLINDMETLPALREVVNFAKNRRTYILINAAAVQGQRHVDAENAAREFGFAVCPVVLHHRSAYGDAPTLGKGVVEYEPEGKAALEVRQLYKFVHKELNS
jgi:chromosome partitioning protein